MSANSSDADERRKRRSNNALERQQKKLRDDYGPGLASIISQAVGVTLTVDDFVRDLSVSPALIWPKKIDDAPGLVAAYVGRSKALGLLSCIGKKLGLLSGRVGFYEKDFLGLTKIIGADAASLLEVAENAQDSVVLYLDAPIGVFLVDFYRSTGSEPYSIVVQGEDLVHRLETCFTCSSGITSRSRGGSSPLIRS